MNAREGFKVRLSSPRMVNASSTMFFSIKIIREDGKKATRLRLSAIIIDILCPTLVSLTNFWDKYQSGELHSQLYSDLNVDHFRQKFNLPNMKLTVKIPEESYQICKAQMGKKLGKHEFNVFFKYFMITRLEWKVGESLCVCVVNTYIPKNLTL